VKVVSVVGARPQFIKASSVNKALRESGHRDFIIHTGQHYDYEMSQVFFEELELPEPDINLEIGSGSHGRQTGEMLIGVENILMTERPDRVLVYGDTNSTLAGALAAVKVHIPVAHVEAGLRSFNRKMPEEHNRVLTDHMSDTLFCPTETAVKHLEREGITQGTHVVGDVMYDSVLHSIKIAEKYSTIMDKLDIKPRCYALATVHRAENTDDHERLMSIFEAFTQIAQDELPVIIPLHPRTRQSLKNSKFKIQNSKIRIINPVSYLDMLMMEKHAHIILTDSGGMQKEAFWFKVPCVTLRDETEWVELVKHGFNTVAGSKRENIYQAYRTMTGKKFESNPMLYGNGEAGIKIVEILTK
jgi:UDP-N-acetylglucosamine 2-epimerase